MRRYCTRHLPSRILFLRHRLVDEEGDTGLHVLSIRRFKHGGELLLDALRTFMVAGLLSRNINEIVGLMVIDSSLTNWV
ncbi:hypothetical protein M413DRAFT_391254 [Hebeloma cylindrosporum]|uniref:Uncharacterized protein n=1 Tax=Hebeloma cylindrosporum TaxID=76867 RepID=A0A0C3BDF0_HEBCY|nr:hypothetical protein M413DRAFT_391254 [Hebeloma cylindrosporum h7]